MARLSEEIQDGLFYANRAGCRIKAVVNQMNKDGIALATFWEELDEQIKKMKEAPPVEKVPS